MSIHELIYTFLAAFAALFPVMNPIGNGFIIDGLFQDIDDSQRKLVVKKIFLNCLIVAIGSLAIGHFILQIFGLAIPIIQIGGGIIICKTGLELLSSSSPETGNTNNTHIAKINMEEIEQKLFYPVAFPIVVGAGSISVIFTLTANATVEGNLLHTGINYLFIALAIFAMLTILAVFLLQGRLILKRLGKSGNLVINKLIAFITFCIGIQIIVTGISGTFHIPIL
jgi:MarC family membrane protein